MAAAHRARRKKLIRAVETSERLGRPNCRSCNDKLREQRGCKAPGYDLPPARLWVFTSPEIPEAERVLKECPVGRILRESPHVYDVIAASSYAEHAGLAMLSAPRYFQRAVMVVESERERIRKMNELDHQAKRDASYATGQVRKANRHGTV